MCVYSMIMDHYGDKWGQRVYPPIQVPLPFPFPPINFPFPPINPTPTMPEVPVPTPIPVPLKPVSPEEVEEFRELLRKAREYDKRTGQKDCEEAQKRQKILDLANSLGIDVSFVKDDSESPKTEN